MELVEERAIQNFKRGYNCAESVLKGVVESVGSDIENPQRLAAAFGGGIARQGYVCGCLSGAAIAIGLLAGRTAPDDQAGKDKVYAAVTHLFEKFKVQAGSLECRDISGLKFDQPTHLNVCCPLVGFTARAACEEIAHLQENKR